MKVNAMKKRPPAVSHLDPDALIKLEELPNEFVTICWRSLGDSYLVSCQINRYSGSRRVIIVDPDRDIHSVEYVGFDRDAVFVAYNNAIKPIKPIVEKTIPVEPPYDPLYRHSNSMRDLCAVLDRYHVSYKIGWKHSMLPPPIPSRWHTEIKHRPDAVYKHME